MRRSARFGDVIVVVKARCTVDFEDHASGVGEWPEGSMVMTSTPARRRPVPSAATRASCSISAATLTTVSFRPTRGCLHGDGLVRRQDGPERQSLCREAEDAVEVDADGPERAVGLLGNQASGSRTDQLLDARSGVSGDQRRPSPYDVEQHAVQNRSLYISPSLWRSIIRRGSAREVRTHARTRSDRVRIWHVTPEPPLLAAGFTTQGAGPCVRNSAAETDLWRRIRGIAEQVRHPRTDDAERGACPARTGASRGHRASHTV